MGVLSGRVAVIAHTEAQEVIRIISVRKATKNEEASYFKHIAADWKRVDGLRDRGIDFSDTPELTPEMFARAVVRRDLKPDARKKQLTMRVDGDVLEWYRKQGPGYQTRINALLRAYMQERKNTGAHT